MTNATCNSTRFYTPPNPTAQADAREELQELPTATWTSSLRFQALTEGTNPEQLFAVGWSACYLSALQVVAHRMKIRLPADAAVDSEVDLGTTNGAYLIQARLNVHLPGIAPDVARMLVERAHLECPYSKATHGNINLDITA